MTDDPDMYDRAEQAYARITEGHLDHGDNAVDIDHDMAEWVVAEYGEGAFTRREITVALGRDLMGRVKDRARDRGNRVLRDIAGGQLTLRGFGDVDWRPVLVDPARRTTVRNLTAKDIRRMRAVREGNVQRAEDALAEFDRNAETVIDLLDGFETLGEYATASLPDEGAAA